MIVRIIFKSNERGEEVVTDDCGSGDDCFDQNQMRFGAARATQNYMPFQVEMHRNKWIR